MDRPWGSSTGSLPWGFRSERGGSLLYGTKVVSHWGRVSKRDTLGTDENQGLGKGRLPCAWGVGVGKGQETTPGPDS